MQRLALPLLVVLVLGALATVTVSQDAGPSSRVVFVDVQKVFETYRKRTDVEARLNAEMDALDARFKKQAADVEHEAERLETLNPGSVEHTEVERRVDMLRFGLKYDRESEQRRLQRQMNREKTLIYKEIVLEAQALGEARGYAAVQLYVPFGAELDRNMDPSVMMATRTVLWRDDRLDVTRELVDSLNAALPPAPK
jgi:Skp family chaperone for outer membrane proteins